MAVNTGTARMTAAAETPAETRAETGADVSGSREPTLTFTFSDRHIIAVLATLATALFAFATRLRLNEQPWGDEPHYLIMSIALSKYHSFDLTAAYTNRDYWEFYPQEIAMHVFPAADGTMVPLHNFGGPLLWALPFEWWGRAGAAGVVALVSVLTVVNIYWLLRELGIVKAYAGLVTGLFVVGSPLYMYASMQFIEPLGALPVVFAVRAILMPRPSWIRVAAASAGLGYLPWIHGRFIIFTVVLGGLLIARVDHRTWRFGTLAYLPAILPITLVVASLELFNLTMYGTLNPAPGNATIDDGLFQIPVQTGLAGLLFDRQFGLLSHFPILALAVPGMLLALRRRNLPSHVVILGTVLVYVLSVSTFKSWWAGWSPPGRLLAVLTPLLAYYVAVVLQRLHSWIVTTLATLGAAVAFLISVTGDYRILARFTESGGVGKDPILAELAERLHLGDIVLLLPAVRYTPYTGTFVLWYLAFVIFVAVVWLAGRYRPARRIPMRPIAPLFPVVGTVAGTVVGTVARLVRPASTGKSVAGTAERTAGRRTAPAAPAAPDEPEP